MGRSVLDTPLSRGMTGKAPACFPALLAPNKDREIGGGRATRQPGQVRKEAALTRSGSGRSSVSYLFFERIAQNAAAHVALEFARRISRQSGCRLVAIRMRATEVPLAGFERQSSADRSMTDAGSP